MVGNQRAPSIRKFNTNVEIGKLVRRGNPDKVIATAISHTRGKHIYLVESLTMVGTSIIDSNLNHLPKKKRLKGALPTH